MNRTHWSLPGYVEEQELGSGAQGRVVLARHESSGHPVAVKYLAPALLGNPRARETFRSEAELLKRVTDPHVTRLFDYIETAEGAAIVMEAVPGSSLRRALDERDEPLAPEAALTLLKGSLLGLAAAHAVGVVHRDYKPANVLVLPDGQSKLIDFGIAVFTGQGDGNGTPFYMAPEQWAGRPASPATDLYAATCVFFECITGTRPYSGPTIDALRSQHLQMPPPTGRAPEPLRPLIAWGLAKDPVQRAWSATDFVARLEAVAVQSYGSDWERRGLLALGGLAAALGTVVPLAVLGSAMLAPGIATTSVAAGGATSTAGQSAAAAGSQAGAASGKGILAKIGGGKAAAAIGGTGAAAVAATVFLWPTPERMGGQAGASYRMYFTRPGVVLDNASIPDGAVKAGPMIDLAIVVSPARAKLGTKIKLTTHENATSPWGLEYRGPSDFRCHAPNSTKGDAYHQSYSIAFSNDSQQDEKLGHAWLYRFRKDKPPSFPPNNPIHFTGPKQRNQKDSVYDNALCAWRHVSDTVTEIILPHKGPKPGRYQISPNNPVGIFSVQAQIGRDFKYVSPSSVGARVEGSLPVIEILAS
ncbi:serine/threonine-protein kinase [Actinomadura macrotermitis]|uniref:non-specific serine/threonine protein kinase n=1 Tax=Actinomadura macrotermitis TaxID=2585200 RepID=A0A7K0BRV3_9ACTN|nr:serine/threonine-protein kinase [Actinomadura macrotermitis]MQY03756.1 Serine/threonine-protein kinase PknD [Actinomadura macrotermitis]